MIYEQEIMKERIISQKEIAEWGTFRDSLRAPVHNWFTYPAGFSYRAVEYSIRKENLKIGKDTIYDPFMGSGTTNLVAKTMGFNSVGVEAHPFVYNITQAKIFWEISGKSVLDGLDEIKTKVSKTKRPQKLDSFLAKEFPELILKCFLPETLFEMLIVRNCIREMKKTAPVKRILNVALICVLRDISIAATGWPYIAPNKIKITSLSKNGLQTYCNRVLRMLSDIEQIKNASAKIKTEHSIILGDSRCTQNLIESKSVSHIFTSPPYLNNFDYADRTRLEMYFMGEADNWGDISDKIRTKLITSATTQISRTDEKYNFDSGFIKECTDDYIFLKKAVDQLSELRLVKGGKKSYDLLVTGYFNDLYRILKESQRVLKEGKKALYILGDSAPYGVHIPTDTLIGSIGVAVGFKSFKIDVLRQRGGKWANNPQRHSVPLRESVVTLYN